MMAASELGLIALVLGAALALVVRAVEWDAAAAGRAAERESQRESQRKAGQEAGPEAGRKYRLPSEEAVPPATWLL